MKNKVFLIALLLVSLCCAGFAFGTQKQSKVEWEYKIYSTSVDRVRDEKSLNGFGVEGWELVQKDGEFFYLKRQK
jgi:hypothetical protein